MAAVKLTKNELRDQERKLSQLQKYLPTLQLKKALLQVEVNQTMIEIAEITKKKEEARNRALEFASLLSEHEECDLTKLVEVAHVNKSYENIAGVEIPTFSGVTFQEETFFLFDTPVWLESALTILKELVSIHEHLQVTFEKKRALEKELREVSIRVNLFEKVLIVRCKENIKKIKVFLGDQMLAQIAQAKVAKSKIEQRA